MPNPSYSNASHSQPLTQYAVTQAAARGDQGQDLPAVGGRDPFDDVHHDTGDSAAPGSAACSRISASDARA